MGVCKGEESVAKTATRRTMRDNYSPHRIRRELLKLGVDAIWELRFLKGIMDDDKVPVSTRFRAYERLSSFRAHTVEGSPGGTRVGPELIRGNGQSVLSGGNRNVRMTEEEKMAHRMGPDFMAEVDAVDG